MAALRRYRICAGEPSYRTISRLGRGNLAASTLFTALRSDELPSLAVVLAVVTACGASGEDQKRFATACGRALSPRLRARGSTAGGQLRQSGASRRPLARLTCLGLSLPIGG